MTIQETLDALKQAITDYDSAGSDRAGGGSNLDDSLTALARVYDLVRRADALLKQVPEIN